MPNNIFITRKEWQAMKVKYSIPDKVVKSGSFGDKLDGFYKKYETSALHFVTMKKVPVAQELIKQANKLYDEWLSNAEKLKPEAFKGQPNKTKAIDQVKQLKKYVVDLENRTKATKDPFIGSRTNYDKCLVLFKEAFKTPDDASALQRLYSQGIRNHIGAEFHKAVTTWRGDASVLKLLNDYEKLAGSYDGPMQHNGPADIAADPAKRKKFMADMEQLMRIGGQILKETKA